VPDHRELMGEAIAAEAEAQRALFAGEDAEERFMDASRLYRASWEAAPPGSYGRLIGMLKATVLAGDAGDAAAYVRSQVPAEPPSHAAAYALAIAALVEGDDTAARAAAEGMRGGSAAFDRTGAAITALAERDGEAFADMLATIVADFEGRDEHLTGVPIADTALMLDRLAEPRGLASHPRSPLLPA
jgi:hypothetical protein